jgi:uncharacterized protein (DUF1800 family)
VLGKRRQRLGPDAERGRHRRRGAGPDHRHLREGLRHVAELHVLGKDQLIELRQHRVLHVSRHRQQHDVAELVDVQVRDHAPCAVRYAA